MTAVPPINRVRRESTLSRDEYRERIVQEILETEISYVDSLHTCIVYYYEKLQTCQPPILSRKQIEDIFLYFDQVYNVNQAFLNDLQTYKIEGKLSRSIGETFQRFIPYLKVYYQFIGNSGVSLHTLTELEQSEYICSVFEDLRCQIPGTNQLDLRGFLIMPVQRLPRYNLLLTDLLKRTPDTYVDYPKIEVALKEMKKLTDSANKAIVAAERRRRLFLIEGRISGFSGKLVEPHRCFIKEGMLMKVCRKTIKPRYFYLFNDILIYGIGDSNNMVISQVVDVANIVVKNVEESVNGFELFTNKKSFVVYAIDQNEKQEWMDEINKAVEKMLNTLRTRNQLSDDTFIKPLFVPDDTVVKCMICNKPFSFFIRRHHCRFCGKCVCGDCSLIRLPQPPLNTFERACSVCVDRRLLSAEPIDKDRIRSSLFSLDSISMESTSPLLK
ncbi:Rho guanine nucleotide exchange factor, putative [Entamoeba histolytica HM-1:IMSS-B]|uniref:Rho guanine nucleotide exchange factor, putative n=6 Tax=Entamoeba histolytica TaxID=5759 RepID=C4LU20_ENTH1|nr:Rho guanine nucleotide exchange factor, putative [Entamoeba histolytica HM-1:IMSS]EMD47690.1 rho/RAC guanine nucleotide exchange factor, putative [Entamoeba histolytica KU27]EMH72439.1 Rho guanine nucleotide exchange factor, putative [Entamoeba histolytica HM-1:IMSS-B]EMS16972.1 Rho/RAC guanine nucleotide exchange factor, putative [Entamoeba histolytica HM-3:IMSS]ENY61385.1 Rho/RAC guanine nucleotide exchange factor, putative [Entamoeba histolytica HM-1:IMSS-A]BAN38396.1 rho guanine nucleot|eukprot:XP_651719.1 Rho guanine nucleotide exchange factor, putative [Entamoeba histolytica HM-1:IMSS]